jgi:NitT/TauT family transport system permease protein
MKWSCVSTSIALVLWYAAAYVARSPLLPSPLMVGSALLQILTDPQTYQHLSASCFRVMTGLILSGILALFLGVLAGSYSAVRDALSPLIVAVQSCPTIVWVSLFLVWVGSGHIVPVLAVVLGCFPPMFINIAQGMVSLDRRLLSMARLYRVPRMVVFRDVIIPGLRHYAVSAFSYALGISWKVTCTAEYIASAKGIGSQIYWSYRELDINRLFAWTLLLIAIGLSLDRIAVGPIQRRLDGD